MLRSYVQKIRHPTNILNSENVTKKVRKRAKNLFYFYKGYLQGGHLSCQTLRVESCQTLRVGSCQTLRVASCQTLFFEGRKLSDSNWKLSDTV